MSRLIDLTIDVNSRKVTKFQDLVKVGDALSLSITALNGSSAYDFTGQTVQVFLKKADNTKVEQDATVSGNVINIATMSEQSSAYVGQVEGELLIKDSQGNQITSSTFIYEVEGSVNNEVLVESQNDVQILDEIQTLIDGYNLNADNLAVQNTQATSNISTLTQKNSDAATAQSNLQTVINNANAFASTYNGLSAVQVSVTNLNYKIEAAAELTRDTIPSGFTQLSDLDYTTMSTTPNTIKSLSTSADSIAYVNGYKIKIPAGTVITLDAPPTTGTRDDLVFLECWKQTDVSGAITWNSRIRVVDGVDFATYPEGITNRTAVFAQGGKTTVTGYFFAKSTTDAGLYYAGTGLSADQTALNTTDGYVYAIPMFRVHRRNSGGYSVSNGNGSIAFTKATGITYLCQAYSSANVTVSQSFYDATNVGDYLGIDVSPNDNFFKVTSKNGSLSLTILSLKSYTVANNALIIRARRSDGMLADIIDVRDIIDLRHQVSLTGFNYQALLEENFDKLLRGELQTNAKTSMLKTYHGIPKTPIDANTVFYASFDGTTTAELGGTGTTIVSDSFLPMPTGLGTKSRLSYSLGTISNLMTIDCTIKILTSNNATYPFTIFTPSGNSGSGRILDLTLTNGLMYLEIIGDSGYTNINIGAFTVGTTYYIRVVLDKSNKKITGYLNGKLINNATLSTAFNCANNTDILVTTNGTTSYDSRGCVVSDLSISNIDRGATFATLPQDFIDGYARISTAMNEQRQTYSDALTSEYKCEQVKASGETKRQYTISQATTGQWTAGDTVKVKGLGGEIITGVIDSDTALARVIQAVTTSAVIPVDDVSKFTVSDTITLFSLNSNASLGTWTINSVDTTNKTITLSSTVSIGTDVLIFETTASSSSPTVKATATGTAQAGAASTITLPSTFNPTDSAYNNLTITITSGTGAGQVRTISSYVGSTKVATVSSAWTTAPNNTSVFSISGVPVAGTWSNLGTNQATFTLGTLYALTTQNIQVEYSLNEVAGQGGVPEVLTTTLAGEFSGKKLTVNPSVHLRDDFVGKVSGSTTVNPNIMKFAQGGVTSLLPPNHVWFSETQSNAVSYLDNTTYSIARSTNGEIAQQLFSFDLISIVERKYGTIPALDTAGKVAWLKANIASIKCNWWGYGSCPSGNKAYFNIWNPNSASWTGSPATHSNNTVATLNWSTTSISSYIQSDGTLNYLAYTDASDGVTPSTIYTDYVNIEVTFTTPTGTTVLAPENPRRDDGLNNILLLLPENKKIQAMFGGVSNSSGIISYGDMVPKQGILTSTLSLVGGYSLVMPRAYLTTLTTKTTGMIFNSKTNFGFLDEYSVIDTTISSALTDGSQLFADTTAECSMLVPVALKSAHTSNKSIVIGKIYNVNNTTLTLDDSNGSVVRYIDTSTISNANSKFVSVLVFLLKDSSGTLYLLAAVDAKNTSISKATIASLNGYSRLLAFRVNNRPITK